MSIRPSDSTWVVVVDPFTAVLLAASNEPSCILVGVVVDEAAEDMIAAAFGSTVEAILN